MKKEIRIPYREISNAQTMTEVQEAYFHRHGVDMERHECDIEDDHDREERVLKVQTEKRYFYSPS
jgi:hypothetical protein